jgi:hypothetical protein
MVTELDKELNKVMELIQNTSYGSSSQDLWEVLGRITYIMDSSTFIVNELKKELGIEHSGVEATTEEDLGTGNLKVTFVPTP